MPKQEKRTEKKKKLDRTDLYRRDAAIVSTRFEHMRTRLMTKKEEKKKEDE